MAHSFHLLATLAIFKNTKPIAMKKKECPSCAMEVDDKSKECPICGYEFPGFSISVKFIAILLILIILLYFIF